MHTSENSLFACTQRSRAGRRPLGRSRGFPPDIDCVVDPGRKVFFDCGVDRPVANRHEALMGRAGRGCHLPNRLRIGVQEDARPMKPNPILIFLQANGFSQAYNILSDQEHLPPTTMASIGYPQIVLSAFAIELYLKCLICIETGRAPPHGHHLKHLFDRLAPETRRRICSIWEHEIKPLRAALWDALEATSPAGKRVPRDLPGPSPTGARPSRRCATSTRRAVRT